MMSKAIWNGLVIADSKCILKLNGTCFFPHQALQLHYFTQSKTQKLFKIIGTANYYHLEVNGKRLDNAAYYFPNPKPHCKIIQNFIVFTEEIDVYE